VDREADSLVLRTGLENNGQARSRYAAERLSELDQNGRLIERRTYKAFAADGAISMVLSNLVPSARMVIARRS